MVLAQDHEEGVLVSKGLEFVVDDFHGVTDDIVFLFQCSEASQYGVINSFNENDLLERIKFIPLTFLIIGILHNHAHVLVI